jgi:hypothetical protein
MIDPIHLLKYVIRPVLKDLDLWSVEAEQLVLGTACQESKCGEYLVQLGGGPALGIYQMEPATHDDIWRNYLPGRAIKYKISDFAFNAGLDADEMIGNLYYATAMCRIHYLRVPEKIPVGLHPQAAYWKKYYNTPLGAGTINEYINSWERFVGN